MSDPIRKICVVVTARPSYSRIKTALTAIDRHPALQLQLVVAASALLSRYGSAVAAIEADGFHIDRKIGNVVAGENLEAQAKTTGLGIIELASAFTQLEPDAVLTIADRFETMATAIAATYLNIPLIHIQGGEVTGNIDEKVRHAITKLADIHLTSTARARERVIRMGENTDSVFLTGCPSIDLAERVRSNSKLDFHPYQKYGGVGDQPDFRDGYLVVLQHPVTSEYDSARMQIQETLHAVNESRLPAFIFWSNVDAGSDGTSNGIRSFRENHDTRRFHFFKNMEPEDFLRLLVNAKCLVGNSSVGIRECAYLGVPVVNIGVRQQGRERGQNVIDVDYDRSAILEALRSQLKLAPFGRDVIYGDGEAGPRIAEILATAPLTFTKRITY